jgi:hypothetical protein
MMHGHEKSRSAIVAVKPTNKVARPAEQSAVEPAAAELVEPRAEAEGKAGQQSTHRAQYRVCVTQALDRIRQAIAVVTRGGNRMRESCTYGSVRGAPSNGCPYRDRREFITLVAGATAAWTLTITFVLHGVRYNVVTVPVIECPAPTHGSPHIRFSAGRSPLRPCSDIT